MKFDQTCVGAIQQRLQTAFFLENQEKLAKRPFTSQKQAANVSFSEDACVCPPVAYSSVAENLLCVNEQEMRELFMELEPFQDPPSPESIASSIGKMKADKFTSKPIPHVLAWLDQHGTRNVLFVLLRVTCFLVGAFESLA